MAIAQTEQKPPGDFLSFVKGLAPEDRLCESVCGVIMVLSILLTAGYYVVGTLDPARARF